MLEVIRSIWCWIITFLDYLLDTRQVTQVNREEEQMGIDKNFYNESSAKNLGWDPSWFGQKYFDEQLTRAIKKWQKNRGLAADGLCGPATYRRIWTERQADIDYHKPVDCQYSNYIVYNGEFHQLSGIKSYSGQSLVACRLKRGRTMITLVDLKEV